MILFIVRVLRSPLLYFLWLIVLLYIYWQFERTLKLEEEYINSELLNLSKSVVWGESEIDQKNSLNEMTSVDGDEYCYDDVLDFMSRTRNEKVLMYSSNMTEFITRFWHTMTGNRKAEEKSLKPALWPEEDDGDRIIQQFIYRPDNYSNVWRHPLPISKLYLRDLPQNAMKKILYIGDDEWRYLPQAKSFFFDKDCPVNSCAFAESFKDTFYPDAVIFKGRYSKELEPYDMRRPDQVWILYLLESPQNVDNLGNLKHVINWTVSYRHDSDIVIPSGKFVPYVGSPYVSEDEPLLIDPANYAANKTKKVAWFVSNCKAKNSRLEYAEVLKLYIEVDIFGSCGINICPRALHRNCLGLLDKHYKFYLSFENGNCVDYITEKFFENGLRHNVIPIVMGARREDYARVAPPHSFIHVDDFRSPKELARYLHKLDKNDVLFNSYFAWKNYGEVMNPRFWCRLCAMLHAPLIHKSYEDIEEWWNKNGTCNARGWR